MGMKMKMVSHIHEILPKVIFVLALGLISALIPLHAKSAEGVLVVAESSEIQQASILEIRRIYLGLPSSGDSLIRKPVINLSNREAYKAFLKNVMHMTEKGYRRKLIKRIFRLGGGKIAELESVTKLVEHLTENPNDISFMDKAVAEKTKGIRVVQVLW